MSWFEVDWITYDSAREAEEADARNTINWILGNVSGKIQDVFRNEITEKVTRKLRLFAKQIRKNINGKNRNRILGFFQERYEIKYLSSIFKDDTIEKISLLYSDYSAFFDDIPNLIDYHSAGAMITDSWITFNEDWGFSIYRISQWDTEQIDFTKSECETMLSHW